MNVSKEPWVTCYQFHPVWALGESYLLPLIELLPFGLSNFVAYTKQDWPFSDRYRLHERIGPAFTLISPSKIIVVVGDPDAAEEVSPTFWG